MSISLSLNLLAVFVIFTYPFLSTCTISASIFTNCVRVVVVFLSAAAVLLTSAVSSLCNLFLFIQTAWNNKLFKSLSRVVVCYICVYFITKEDSLNSVVFRHLLIRILLDVSTLTQLYQLNSYTLTTADYCPARTSSACHHRNSRQKIPLLNSTPLTNSTTRLPQDPSSLVPTKRRRSTTFLHHLITYSTPREEILPQG